MSQIEQLRQILVGDSAEQLGELKDRIENVERRANDVSEVLAPAIDAGLKHDDQLINSLQEPVATSLKRAIRKEPKAYAEILYPVMSPLIRHAISQAISSLLITINRTMESATSVSGLGMRLRSMSTGVPYAELALRRSLVYQIEHIFLIDRDTGMLMDEAKAEHSQALDSDAVSGMFSAIQSFVQDSFSQDASARLTDLKVGDHNVWVAHGPKVMLACVIYGDAPESLKRQLYDSLDAIRINYANQIADFSGDTQSMEGVDRFLIPLLQLKVKDGVNSKPKARASGGLFIWLLVMVVLAYFAYHWIVQDSKRSAVEHYLRDTPGIALTATFWNDDKLVVEGLKDPDANVPFKTLEAYGIKPEDLVLKTIPFRSLELDMELQRFANEFSLPQGVYLSKRDKQVYLYGEASIAWLVENDARVRQLSTDGRLNISDLSASFESVSEILQANFRVDELDRIRIASVVGSEFTALLIGGRMRASKLALLQAIFAGNPWVEVSVTQL